ncbi:MAG: hypothetical protein H6Q65_2722 [Firmicutes bacterium]|nr:hypothetical protein [Bacillota bacterium]
MIVYWEEAGPQNTDATITAALTAAKEKGISYIVVASTSGDTALKLAEQAAGQQVVCVSHAYGTSEPGVNEMAKEARDRLRNIGVEVYAAAHVLSGAERAISRRFSGAYPVEIVAHSLRMLGQGVKVCVEISIMALDKDIVVVAGSGKGADTAVIIRPAHAINLFDTYIKEIICKPLHA